MDGWMDGWLACLPHCAGAVGVSECQEKALTHLPLCNMPMLFTAAAAAATGSLVAAGGWSGAVLPGGAVRAPTTHAVQLDA